MTGSGWLCVGLTTNVDMWVSPDSPKQRDDLMRLCRRCTTKRECAALALAEGGDFDVVGVWAGEWLPERRKSTLAQRERAFARLSGMASGLPIR